MSFQFGLPLTSDMLEMLIHWCSVEGGGKGDATENRLVAYEEFITLMNWKAPVMMERRTCTKIPTSCISNDTTVIPTSLSASLTLKGATHVHNDTTPTTADKTAHAPADKPPKAIMSTTDDATPTNTVKPTPMGATPTPVDDALIGKVPTIEIEGLKSSYRTSSQYHRATAGSVPTGHLRSYGVPTIRSDIPAPRIKRVSERKVRSKSPTIQWCCLFFISS